MQQTIPMEHRANVMPLRVRDWLALRHQLLWAYDRRFRALHDYVVEQDDCQSLLRIRRGWIEVGYEDGTKLRAGAGNWMLTRQERRWQSVAEDSVILSIGFRFHSASGDALYDQGLPVVFAGRSGPLLDRAEQLQHQVQTCFGSEYYPMERKVGINDFLASQQAFQGFLSALVDRLLSEGLEPALPAEGDSRVRTALRQIADHARGKFPSVKALAKRVGLSVQHLDRLMVEETGYTVHEHGERHRLVAICDELRGGRHPLKRIAYEYGFSSAGHFSNWFKLRMGESPRSYRQHAGSVSGHHAADPSG